MSIDTRRVVVTGIGVVSPYGYGRQVMWENLIAGKSGIKEITLIDVSNHPSKIAGEFTDFDPADYIDKRAARRMDRFSQFAVTASKLAVEDAKLDLASVDKDRIGVCVGSGAGGMGTIEAQHIKLMERGPSKCSPFTVPMMIADIAAGLISIELKLRGPNKATISACATGTHCIGDAFHLIKLGCADMMFAGGTEAPITPLSMAGFAVARALSLKNDEPTKASRPWDKARDGFVMAEGAGILILESLEHAKARGATIYAEITGYGASADANDLVAPCEDGSGAALAMEAALKFAGLKPEQMQYLNAHGTSTPLGDLAELRAVRKVFGDCISELTVSSTKSMTGHALGAAGGIEAAACLMAMQDNIIPPTINLEDVEEEVKDFDLVPNTAKKVESLDRVMSNSFGFGGHNASIIFEKYTD